MHKFNALFILCSMISFAASADEKYDALLKRIEELERSNDDVQLQLSSKQPQTNSFLNNNLTLGGFFEPSYTFIEGPDTKSQGSNSSNILGLNIAAEYHANLRFVSQILTGLSFPLTNPNNNPDAEGLGQPRTRKFGAVSFGAILSQGYLEYSISPTLTIQGGVGYVPFGYALQQRELVLFVRRGGPQIFRTRNLVSPLWSGFNLQGTKNVYDKTLGYSLYTFTPLEGASQPGMGARTYLASSDDKMVGGVSVQSGKINDSSYQTVGTDLRIDMNRFILTTEAVYGFFEFEDPWSVYAEPSFYIVPDKVLIYVFGDYSNNPKNRLGASLTSAEDPIQKWEYGAGVNWLPTSYTRLRLGFTIHDYVGGNDIVSGIDRDYVSFDLSAGVAF